MVLLPVLILLGPGGNGRCEAVRGEGDFEFFLDVASLPGGAQGSIQLLQIAVPVKELRYVENAGAFAAEARFSIALSSGGDVVYKRVFRMTDTREAMPRAKDLSAFLCALDSCSVAPGSYRLSVTVDDLGRRKRTLLGLFHRVYYSSAAKDVVVDVRPFPADAIALADPILVWEFDRSGGFIPNPMQIYGLRKDTLGVYVRAEVPAGEDSVTVRLTLTKETGEEMGQEVLTAPVLDGRSSIARTFDLAEYPAGSYHVGVEAATADGERASAGKDFTVAWELLNWQKPMRDILVEARILLRDKEFDQFKQMSLGEQEAYMKGFWKKLDPTPQTAVNEAYQKFIQRVRFADEHFGDFHRGALSDRGFIYIRLGPPNEIITKPLPHNREDLYEGMDKVATDYKIIDDAFSSFSAARPEKDPRPLIISPEKQRATRGLVGDDVGSFEIWNYNFKGDPILVDDSGMTMGQGLRFLFIDKDGIGVYHLVGSSEDMTRDTPE